LWLARDGEARAVIVRGREDDFAAQRLQRCLREKSGIEVGIQVADEESSPDDTCVVLVGSPASNHSSERSLPNRKST